jgi:hypothetical protein
VIDENVAGWYGVQLSGTGGEVAYVADAGTGLNEGYGEITFAPLDGGSRVGYGYGDRVQPVPGGHDFEYFLVSAGYFSSINVAAFDGTPGVQLAPPLYGGTLQFTPDGTRAVYQLSDALGTSLLSVQLDGGSPYTLSSALQGEFYLSPDGGSVVFLESTDAGTGTMVLADVNSGTRRVVSTDSLGVTSQSMSADGTQLFWNDSHAGFWTEPSAGGTPVELSTSAATGLYWVSPSATSVAWAEVDPLSQSNVVRIGSLTGTPQFAALSFLYSNNYSLTNVPRLYPFWLGESVFIAPRGGSPSPYTFQDGWYLLPSR